MPERLWGRNRDALPQVPGWQVQRCLGRGRSGDVYLAHSLTDRRWAALRVVRERAASPTPYGLEHLVEVHAQIEVEDGWAVVLDLVEGGSLHHHLQARTLLRAGELRTVLQPLAHTLAAVHARGGAHGLVDPRHVLLTRIGRPVLSDLAGARAHPQRCAAGAEGDVLGLGLIGWLALTGTPAPPAWGRAPLARVARAADGAHPAVVAAVQACLDPDPASRPDAQAVVTLLQDCPAPQPLLSTMTTDPAEQVTRRIPQRFLTPPEKALNTAAPRGR